MAEMHEQAKTDYLAGMKYKDIAEKYEVSLATVKSWKTRYAWQRKGMHTKSKKVCIQKIVDQERPAEPEENSDLTENQRLFCLYYIKSFNATQAAIKAGYAKEWAHTEGSRLLRNVKVREEIKRLKGNTEEQLLIDAMDVLNQYAKIAFADMGDYCRVDGYRVRVNSTDEVDTSVIAQVKEGAHGITIKLHDKMKALDKLDKYFDLLPDKFKRQLDQARLELDQKRAGFGEQPQVEDDGFIDALKAPVDGLWDEEVAPDG